MYYVDVGHSSADRDIVYDDTMDDVKRSGRGGTSDMLRSSPPIPGTSAMDVTEDGELEEERIVEVSRSHTSPWFQCETWRMSGVPQFAQRFCITGI